VDEGLTRVSEATRQLGGRAGSTGPPFIADDGPHGPYGTATTPTQIAERMGMTTDG
jgi:hypothetical protein